MEPFQNCHISQTLIFAFFIYPVSVICCAFRRLTPSMAALKYSSSSAATATAISSPPPCPRSPPKYPDMSGKHRELVKVQKLEREIGFLEEELKSFDSLQPASRSCKEVHDYVGANPDPLIPINLKIHRPCRFWRWLCGKSCLNLSWICCFHGCSSSRKTSNNICSPDCSCRQCCSSNPCCRRPECCCQCGCGCSCNCFGKKTGCKQCCCKIPAPSCSCNKCFSCFSCFKCPKSCLCFNCKNLCCCNPCSLFY